MGVESRSLWSELVDRRDPTGSRMGREGSPGPVLKEKTLTGRESWRKVGSGAAEKRALPEAGRVGGKGGSHSAGSSFFFPPRQSLSRRRRPRRKSPERRRKRPINAGHRDITGRSLIEGPGAEGEGGTPHQGVGGNLVAGVGGGWKGKVFLHTLQPEKLTFRCCAPQRAGGAGPWSL